MGLKGGPEVVFSSVGEAVVVVLAGDKADLVDTAAAGLLVDRIAGVALAVVGYVAALELSAVVDIEIEAAAVGA